MKWLKDIWNSIVESDNQPLLKEIESLKKEIESLKNEIHLADLDEHNYVKTIIKLEN